MDEFCYLPSSYADHCLIPTAVSPIKATQQAMWVMPMSFVNGRHIPGNQNFIDGKPQVQKYHRDT